MSTVTEIKSAIESLPDDEYIQLRKWFSEKDWQKWDKQLGNDSDAGKLDFLFKEALEAKKTGKLKSL